MTLENRTILLTGGTGSFGQKFAELALQQNPKAIRIFSRGEYLQDEMSRRFNDSRLRFLIGDVRDKERVYRAMQGVDIVVHAAALKQVPAAEYNPVECIRTNIMGSANIVDAAIDCGVHKVIAVSSDKAVYPVNLYGSTKHVMERLMVQANVYCTKGKPRLSCARYGNVVGSRGSVVPLFQEQAKTGTVTITDERMTRFWLALEKGVQFVMRCLDVMQGGEIFVPKIPSMRIVDLADALAPGCRREITGVRPGEKLHEVLMTDEESIRAKDVGGYYVIEPQFPYWRGNNAKWGEVPPGFRYSSDNNHDWLTREQIIEMAGGVYAST